MCDGSFLVPNLVAFSCYTVNIHLEKWLIRCDTKRAIWWDLYNKYISIFCIKHMNTIYRTLQVNKWWSKKQTFFSFCEINATKFGTKIKFHLISFGLYHAVEIDHTILLLMFVAEKVLLLLVISLTAKRDFTRGVMNLNRIVFSEISLLDLFPHLSRVDELRQNAPSLVWHVRRWKPNKSHISWKLPKNPYTRFSVSNVRPR